MPKKDAYEPEAEFPHIPKKYCVTLLNLNSKYKDGCRIWRGLAKKKRGHVNGRTRIQLYRPDGTTIEVPVARLIWWIHHGTYPGPDIWLSTSCRNVRCILPAHIQARKAPKCVATFPYLPDDVLKDRLDRHSEPGQGGCRIWTGYRCRKRGKPNSGSMRISSPNGNVHLYPHKLAWFLVHRRYPKEPDLLEHLCGNAACINPDHLRLIHRQDHRGMTDAQVTEARKAYWLPFTLLNNRQLTMSSPTAEQLAAWALGMGWIAVQSVVDGNKVVPGKWRGYARTVEHVLRAVELFRPAAELYRQAHATKISIEALAKRYGSNMASMHSAIHGTTYAHVPMPPESRARVRREKLDKVLAQRRAVEQQAEDELAKIYQQAEGLPMSGYPDDGPRLIVLS